MRYQMLELSAIVWTSLFFVSRLLLARSGGYGGMTVAAMPGRDKAPTSMHARTYPARAVQRSHRTLFALLALAALALGARPVAAQAPPDENWKTFDTEHFRVTFPEGLDSLA